MLSDQENFLSTLPNEEILQRQYEGRIRLLNRRKRELALFIENLELKSSDETTTRSFIDELAEKGRQLTIALMDTSETLLNDCNLHFDQSSLITSQIRQLHQDSESTYENSLERIKNCEQHIRQTPVMRNQHDVEDLRKCTDNLLPKIEECDKNIYIYLSKLENFFRIRNTLPHLKKHYLRNGLSSDMEHFIQDEADSYDTMKDKLIQQFGNVSKLFAQIIERHENTGTIESIFGPKSQLGLSIKKTCQHLHLLRQAETMDAFTRRDSTQSLLNSAFYIGNIQKFLPVETKIEIATETLTFRTLKSTFETVLRNAELINNNANQ